MRWGCCVGACWCALVRSEQGCGGRLWRVLSEQQKVWPRPAGGGSDVSGEERHARHKGAICSALHETQERCCVMGDHRVTRNRPISFVDFLLIIWTERGVVPSVLCTCSSGLLYLHLFLSFFCFISLLYHFCLLSITLALFLFFSLPLFFFFLSPLSFVFHHHYTLLFLSCLPCFHASFCSSAASIPHLLDYFFMSSA